ncbi:hypothetical protein KIPB_014221 [Kipferlia bialata]|uniref:Uncharacterized protein n=1 Tax=Kipferlia bialata TaxID=797122 RepID=A0A391PA00_9EUKA|nr:hypothetical protein KIPB_014221 [Kipferlia bialata]|eukprot:g14221.t1
MPGVHSPLTLALICATSSALLSLCMYAPPPLRGCMGGMIHLIGSGAMCYVVSRIMHTRVTEVPLVAESCAPTKEGATEPSVCTEAETTYEETGYDLVCPDSPIDTNPEDPTPSDPIVISERVEGRGYAHDPHPLCDTVPIHTHTHLSVAEGGCTSPVPPMLYPPMLCVSGTMQTLPPSLSVGDWSGTPSTTRQKPQKAKDVITSPSPTSEVSLHLSMFD